MKTSLTAHLIVLLSFYFAHLNGQADSTLIFQDCSACPKMVKIPPGSVYIGSYEEEIDRKKGERPRIEATINEPFALGETEITLGQFRTFMEETNYASIIGEYQGKQLIGCNFFDGKGYGYIAEHNWKSPGYPQREDAPVVCVSWSDAQAYTDWLTKKTGRVYRIPSSVEFEYASRAGSSAPWFWGTDSEKACEYANIGDRAFASMYPSRPSFACEDGYVYTSPVGKFKPNGFGLYDMIGNAWEWTNDCYHADLTNAPVDGSSWDGENDGSCIYRIPKGGSWISGIAWSRAAVRSRDGAHYKSFMLGFRVAAEATIEK